MMRKVIAKRLTESKQTVPHFYLTVDCEIDALLKGRAALNAAAPEKGEGAYKLSVNDFIIKAAAMTLKKVPAANASWSDDGTVMYDRVDVSVAVAIPGGLITPIIFDAANKGLVQISAEMKALAAKARDGKLVPEEYQGGTFSLSNLGMFGIKQFEAVINPPQGCILAIGAGEQRAVVKNGQLAVATVMSCTLSVDHRVVDGAVGAEYMAAFKKLIEEPLGMLL
jgi:pyruvate dehydrogenase E2 component (dihydrolipoamide acetyltransferase)